MLVLLCLSLALLLRSLTPIRVFTRASLLQSLGFLLLLLLLSVLFVGQVIKAFFIQPQFVAFKKQRNDSRTDNGTLCHWITVSPLSTNLFLCTVSKQGKW